ncbi:MAG: hypothetical protein ACYDB1_06225 [Acidiferrobacteraceae bacterium]
MPKTEQELRKRDAKRDIGAELLASVRQMRAAKKGAVHKVDHPSRDDLIAILECLWRKSYDAPKTEKTGIAELDRALLWVESVPARYRKAHRGRTASHLALDLIQLLRTVDCVTQEDVNRKRKAGSAAKKLAEAAVLLRACGSPALGDLCDDLAQGAWQASFGPTFMIPYNMPPGNLGSIAPERLEEYVTLRLYPFGDSQHPSLLGMVKPIGQAAANPASAANGAAVRILSKYFPDTVPEWAAIVSGLCKLVGYNVPAPTVRKIVNGYVRKT